METDPDILAVAREAIRIYGNDAVAVMRKRARDHKKAGEPEGADLWRRVASAVIGILDADSK